VLRDLCGYEDARLDELAQAGVFGRDTVPSGEAKEER
jgi:hypothetical protein